MATADGPLPALDARTPDALRAALAPWPGDGGIAVTFADPTCPPITCSPEGAARWGSIGDGFLYGAHNVAAVALRGTTNVRAIGDNFLHGSWVTQLDLSGLTEVTRIGAGFLRLCGRLTEFRTGAGDEAFRRVTAIGSDFMENCGALETVDLRGFVRLEAISNNFLGSAKRLRTLDATGLSAVKCIGNNFLRLATGLTEVEVGCMERLESIGNGFLYGCSGLTRFDTVGLWSLSACGNGFLYDCARLEEVDCSGLVSLESVGMTFLDLCPKLRAVKYTPNVAAADRLIAGLSRKAARLLVPVRSARPPVGLVAMALLDAAPGPPLPGDVLMCLLGAAVPGPAGHLRAAAVRSHLRAAEW